MGKILDFYKNNGKDVSFDLEATIEIEETEEETLYINEGKLKEELEKIKNKNKDAGITILLNQSDIHQQANIKKMMDTAKQVEAEQSMFEFDEE